MSDEIEPLAYVGVDEAGNMRAAIVDCSDCSDERRKQIADNLREFVKCGLTIHRATCEYVRRNFGKKFNVMEALATQPANTAAEKEK